jgi:hypothetical protein
MRAMKKKKKKKLSNVSKRGVVAFDWLLFRQGKAA